MIQERVIEKLDSYSRALKRLEEALLVDESNDYIYDAVIKRFEFTYELSWKLLKAFIEYKGGADVRFPRDIFKEAYFTRLIQEGDVWIAMMKDRNLTSHTYNEQDAQQIYVRIKTLYLTHFIALKETIAKGLQDD
ncbi:nucleotidyltransferase [Heliobacterium gestii]|uniref:Nucleotidyltransferase n=1 Tax=Heliomicrobium gestii TaxID=2699 RepID=A0A845LG99_HELGE|nr:nucleotidyltransferase substrate binding protein [Heliomicrobium gestii]MBM7865636.1 nucleotidyltransferase substrate binding protein (TIGR01987 family) [Heliomicrobium gestii]MZP41886.1 nucleotidyltransferase [Heliomicrobium gestii]